MANCVNVNSKEFKELRRQTNLLEKVLAAKIGLWQEKNGIDNYPTKEDIYSNMTIPNILGIYKKEISGQQRINILQNLKRYKLFNNNPALSIKFSQVGIADLYTWKITNPIEGQGTFFQLSDIDLISIEELEKNKMFQGTPVEFVSEIPTNKTTPVAFRNVNKGEKFLFVKDLFQKKFKDKAWTNSAIQKDGSKATPLSENQFKTIEEFLTFALLHEKAHEYIFKNDNETIGEYEDRVNTEAINKLPKGKTENVKASPKLIGLIKEFIKQIGVDYKLVENIVVDGVKQDANGVALIMQKLIQVVEGKENEALPEEALHFAVEIIQQTNPKLFQQLLKEINGTDIYNQVLNTYGQDSRYKGTDGKPDIIKLKKEAIAKALVSRLEELTSRNMWEKIKDFLYNLFYAKSGMTQASMDVLSGRVSSVNDIDTSEGSVYFQLNDGERVFNKIREVSNKIEKTADGYAIDGVKIPRRVSDLAKDFYSRTIGTFADASDFETAVNDLKAEKGTAGHADIEHAFSLFVDSDTGLLRDEFLNDDDYLSNINPSDRSMYEQLRDNLRNRLLNIEEQEAGTRFMTEATIYSAKSNMAGTVDFLAITPSGKVSILDWKFMAINTEKYDDVPWYKVRAWDIQMTQYKSIIGANYNVKNEDFKQTRMIPILAVYSQADYENEILPKLIKIKIGDVEVKNINEDYLLPVGSTGERTGNEDIDNLVEKLNAVYKKLSEEKVGDESKLAKSEQLNALYKAIRNLQIKGNIVPLINQARILNKQVSMLVDRFNSEFEGKEKSEVSNDKINAFAGMVRVHLEALNPYLELKDLEFLIQEDTPENIKLREQLVKTVDQVRTYIKDLNKIDKKFGEKFIGTSYTPEKVVKGISKWFGNAATLQVDNIQNLFKMANKSFGISNMENFQEVNKITRLKQDYDKWASARGLIKSEYFNILTKSDKNELVDQYDKSFYTTLDAKIKDKNYDWIVKNVDQQAYREYVKEKVEKEKAFIISKPEVGTIEEVKKIVSKKLAKMYSKYDLSTNRSSGWLLYNDVKKFPKRENWESKEWKELTKPENKPAKDFYDYIIERNKYYQEIGYLSGKSAQKFLPWMRRGFTESIVFSGKPGKLGEQFLKSISMDENDTGFGQINPITGEVINTIPKYFLNEFVGDYSTDLFKTMTLYNEFAIKFKNLKDIEEQSLQLLRAERNKKSIVTSKFGTAELKNGALNFNPNNNQNSQLLEDMIKGIVYQQRFIESEVFDVSLGRISGFGKNINDKLGMKVFPEDLEGRQLSVNKTINQLNNSFQLATLGFNSLSALSNFFGGQAQGLINSGKYFTKSEFVKVQAWMLVNKMGGGGVNAKTALAALDFFMPFVDSYNRDAAKNLSLNVLDEQKLQDYLMWMMRKGDETVQKLNFFAFLNNAVIIDNKVLNSREYLKNTEEYIEFYKGTQSERKSRSEKFEKDVKALVAERGVFKIAEIKDGVFSIPGVEQTSDSVIEFRRKVQQFTSDALGSLSEDNKRLINMNVYGSSLMVFKNWIPRLVDVRFGDIKYNAASDAYEWGRMRTVYSILITDIMKSINSLKSSIGGDNDVWIDQVRGLYDKKRQDYFNNTGKQLDMTEDDFITLVNQNIKNQALDVVFLVTLMSTLSLLKANAPDDDEDPAVKNQYKFLVKATDKLTDELSYFYDPSTPFNLIGRGVFPAIGLLQNYTKFLKSFAAENYGLIVGDQQIQDDAKPIKYLMKSFPITNQASGLLPMFFPALAKDLGIKVQGQYGVR
jgi:hypothetical protein